MRESSVRNALGLFLVLSQFVVILTTVWVHFRGGLRFDEMTTAVALLTPMFAVHTTTVVKYIVANRSVAAPPSVSVNLPFVFLSFFFPVLFTLCLMGVVLIKAYGLAFASFEQFKVTLGLVQTGLAVYIGFFINALYEGSTKDGKGSESAASPNDPKLVSPVRMPPTV